MNKLLLADNDPKWRGAAYKSIRKNFSDLEVFEAEDYGKTRQMLQTGTFDVIVIDIRLQADGNKADFSGLDLAKHLVPSTPKILVTSETTFDSIRQLIQISNGLPASIRFVSKKADRDFVALNSEIDIILRNLPQQRLKMTDSIFGKADPTHACDIFVVMPFDNSFDKVFTVFQNASTTYALSCKRADQQFSSRSILNDIWSAISYCDIIIADCTGKNPNVFYEIGIADTLGRPAILVTQEINDIPFDIRSRRLIEYKNTTAGLNKLQTDLENAIRQIRP